jgi:hypothetical protein
LKSTVNSIKNISNEITHLPLLGDKRSFSLMSLLNSKNMSTAKKCELYKVVTLPVVTYSEDTGVMNRADNKNTNEK